MDPLIKSQLLYQLSYTPDALGRRPKSETSDEQAPSLVRRGV